MSSSARPAGSRSSVPTLFVFLFGVSLVCNAILLLTKQPAEECNYAKALKSTGCECPVCEECPKCDCTRSNKATAAKEHQREALHEALRLTAYQLLMVKYGPGPYTVTFTIDTAGHSGRGDPPGNQFTIQLAEPHIVPHAVHYFLTQALSNAWVGGGFIRNAPHVLQADPINNHPQFRNMSDVPYSVAFQDYSPDYTHTKWRVGLAGRPGGPDWYVNLVDNTANHGPGGQRNYDIVEEADSCFGEVVKGKEVIEWMHTLRVKHDGGFNGLPKNVVFTHVEVGGIKSQH